MSDKRRREADWAEARKRCRLSDEEVRLAKELGLNPKSLIKNIPHPGQRWKAPVAEWVRTMHAKRKSAGAKSKPAPGAAAPPRESASAAGSAPDSTGRTIETDEINYDALRDKARDQLSMTFDDEQELDRMVEEFGREDLVEFFGDDLPPTRNDVDRENERMAQRHRLFRRAARRVAEELALLPAVRKVVLIGSVARELWKEVPRFAKFRRAGVQIWHECKDVDLAVWMDDVDDLASLRLARSRALRELSHGTGPGVADHQVEVFLLEPSTDRYLGRVCCFNRCPKGPFKPECLVPGCGQSAFLQQHENFVFDRERYARIEPFPFTTAQRPTRPPTKTWICPSEERQRAR
jgi:predicted nucleotidyltransferase